MFRKSQKFPQAQPSSSSHEVTSPTRQELAQIRHTLNLFKRVIYTVISLIIISLLSWGGITAYKHLHKPAPPPDPVPLSIRDDVNFTVYYPDQRKLPAGYNLDTGSFTSNNLAVVYKVNYRNNTLVFSIQQKPSTPHIQAFYAKNLPLHNNVNTSIGTAAVGVIGTQTFASLPTNGNAWIIITGPPNTDQAKLAEVLQAIKAPTNRPN